MLPAASGRFQGCTSARPNQTPDLTQYPRLQPCGRLEVGWSSRTLPHRVLEAFRNKKVCGRKARFDRQHHRPTTARKVYAYPSRPAIGSSPALACPSCLGCVGSETPLQLLLVITTLSSTHTQEHTTSLGDTKLIVGTKCSFCFFIFAGFSRASAGVFSRFRLRGTQGGYAAHYDARLRPGRASWQVFRAFKVAREGISSRDRSRSFLPPSRYHGNPRILVVF